MKNIMHVLMIVIILNVIPLSVTIAQKALARPHGLTQGAQRMQMVYQEIQSIQHELHALQGEFIQCQQALRQTHPYSMHAKRLHHRALHIHRRGHHLINSMKRLMMTMRHGAHGPLNERLGSIYESINIATRGHHRINHYVRLGGEVLQLLERYGAL